jgi:hypothetical protein
MRKWFAPVFGGAIAFILLLIYAGTLGYMTYHVALAGAQGDFAPVVFPQGVVAVFTTIGGLVSALVIAKLAITTPGENPAIVQQENLWVAGISLAYLMVWLLSGLAALVIGVIMYPGINQTVSDLGTTWLGIAVASGYAYFSLDPLKQGAATKALTRDLGTAADASHVSLKQREFSDIPR